MKYFLFIIIFSFLVFCGFLIYRKIYKNYLNQQKVYKQSKKIVDKKSLLKAIKENVGYSFVYGKVETLDPVSFKELKGEYSYIQRHYEVRNLHLNTISKPVVIGKIISVTTETIPSYNWDTVSVDKVVSEKQTFSGINVNYIPRMKPEYIKAINISENERYVYYGSPSLTKLTIFTSLKNKTINETKIYENKTITETLDSLDNNYGIVIFWIFWIILIVVVLICFYRLKNRWLY